MNDKYILNYSVSDVNRVIKDLTEIEGKREKMILISINNYVRRNVTNEEIISYISKQTGYFKSIVRECLDKYEKLGFIKKV